MPSKKTISETTSKSKKASTKNTSVSTKNKSSSAKAKAEKEKRRVEAELYIKRNRFIKATVFFALTIFIFCLYILPDESGRLWTALRSCYWGFFGFCGVFIPMITMYCAVQYVKKRPAYRFKLKVLLFALLLLIFSTMIYACTVVGSELSDYGAELNNCFIKGSEYSGAGLFGGLIGIVMVKLFGGTGTIIISLILLISVAMITFDSIILNIFHIFQQPVKNVGNRINENKEIRRQIKKQEEEIKNEQRKQEREAYVKKQVEKHLNTVQNSKKPKIDDLSSDFCNAKSTPFYEPHPIKALKQSEAKPNKNKRSSKKASNSIGDDTLDSIFGNQSSSKYLDKPEKKSEETQIQPIDTIPDSFEYVIEESSPINIEYEDEPVTIGNDFYPQVQKISEKKSVLNEDKKISQNNPSKNKEKTIEPVDIENNSIIEGQYIRPPVTLLEPQPEDNSRNISLELNQNGTMLVDTLKSFGVQTTIVNISRGPSVTRYELQPAAGVKISKITNLADDIAMNLAATGVRIEAPIPGKSAVGIEVPNKNVSVVKMRNLIESEEFINSKSKLTVALGYDITGKITLADLGKMPHLLIAGSTGSGKSVCINSMLVSLLYKSTPDEVKLMLIDPKVVELGVYNGIPNLIVPVVTDPRKAAGALNWAVNEMLERYKTFAEYNVRDMHSYNRLVDKQNLEYEESFDIHSDNSERSFEEDEMLAQVQTEVDVKNPNSEPHKLEKMPQIVIVIDELADLMMAAPNEVEESICRLAQMARAAGMHLVIATQRPSVDVITGLIKANIPSRIAFAVKSQIDSRTILDSGGAEKLLGRGDMLFSPIGTTKPIRVQGCYVDDSEIEKIIDFIKKSKVVEYDNNVIEEIEKNAVAEPDKDSATNSGDVDPVMEQAIKCVVEAGQASTSLLQRRLRLGYARAGRLIDEMEQMGIVGPHEGSKPRQVLMSYQQWLERNMARSDNDS